MTTNSAPHLAPEAAAGPSRRDEGALTAAQAPRIAIESVQPSLELGRFAAKAIVGEPVDVSAVIFADGHDVLTAAVSWCDDQDRCRREPMHLVRPLGKDIWEARFTPQRVGRHTFAIEAWWDVFGTYRDELFKKHQAGVPVELELEEGRRLVAAAAERSQGELREALDNVLERFQACGSEGEQVGVLLDARTAHWMHVADARPHLTRSEAVYPLEVERRAAQFASWYELFPRSETDDPRRHGTFNDVHKRLPMIRDMGFDVLYFPPIHPVGRAHRKGRNNTLQAGPDDPGSPYAIGSEEGGHEAIHPELGSREDFRNLVRAAADHGLEIALDFAIQCSPDHPWLEAHPGWFSWRPDGSIRYAENPAQEISGHRQCRFLCRGRDPVALAGAARRGAGLGGRRGQDLSRRQPAHQAIAVLGVADRRHSRARPGRAVPGRGLHPAGDDEAAGQDRLQHELHLFHLAQHQGRAERVPDRAQRVADARVLSAQFLRQHAGHQPLLPAVLGAPRIPDPCRAGDHGFGAVGHVLRLRAVRGRAGAGQGGISRLGKVPDQAARLYRARQHHLRDYSTQPHPPRESGAADPSGSRASIRSTTSACCISASAPTTWAISCWWRSISIRSRPRKESSNCRYGSSGCPTMRRCMWKT